MVREGRKSDLPAVLDLIKELAVFERAGDEVETTVESMEADGFGDNPLYKFLVAEVNQKVVGVALYYYRYSTWKGKRLYLEDLVVNENYRNLGLGKMLFERTGKVAFDEGCSGMAWEVLDWNKDAIDFYKRYGAKIDAEWLNCHIPANVFAS